MAAKSRAYLELNETGNQINPVIQGFEAGTQKHKSISHYRVRPYKWLRKFYQTLPRHFAICNIFQEY